MDIFISHFDLILFFTKKVGLPSLSNLWEALSFWESLLSFASPHQEPKSINAATFCPTIGGMENNDSFIAIIISTGIKFRVQGSISVLSAILAKLQFRKLRFLAKNNKIKVALLFSTVFVITAIFLYKLKGKYAMIMMLSIMWGTVADLFERLLGWCGNNFVVQVFPNDKSD